MQGIGRWTTKSGSFSDGFLKTPPIYNTTTAFCYITMSSSQVFSLFQIRNGASDLSSTGYFSVQSHHLWQRMIILFHTQHYYSHGIACPDFFFIYITSVSVPSALGKNCKLLPRICKLLNTLSGYRVHRDIQKPIGHSPGKAALVDPALKDWGVSFNLKHSVRPISDLSECKHVCTVTPHVTLQFYLATEDKLGNINVLCFPLACSVILRVEKFTASLASWDAS